MHLRIDNLCFLPGDDTRVLVVLEFLFPCIHFAHNPSFLLGNACLEQAVNRPLMA